MKLLIAGATGAIGSAMLQDALNNTNITHIIALTRKPLSQTHAKLSSTTVPDFGNLDAIPQSAWEQMQDADALIWAVGTYTLDENVNLNYPIAFQEALVKNLRREKKEAKFRFILLGGTFVEPDQSKSLWFLGDQRRMKGVLQTKTLEFAEKHGEVWEAFVVRPGLVMFGGATLKNRTTGLVFGDGMAIRAEVLAAATSWLATKGSSECVFENRDLVRLGRA